MRRVIIMVLNHSEFQLWAYSWIAED